MRQVAVAEKMQGRGLGKQMVDFAENFTKENGFEKITSHARISAAGFYTRMQYETISGEFEEVGIPHVKMEKKIR